MSNGMGTRFGRVAAGLLIAGVLVGLGGGVANASDDDGIIQDTGHGVSKVEESTGVTKAEDEVDDATGGAITKVDDETGVTGVEEGAGLE